MSPLFIIDHVWYAAAHVNYPLQEVYQTYFVIFKLLFPMSSKAFCIYTRSYIYFASACALWGSPEQHFIGGKGDNAKK